MEPDQRRTCSARTQNSWPVRSRSICPDSGSLPPRRTSPWLHLCLLQHPSLQPRPVRSTSQPKGPPREQTRVYLRFSYCLFFGIDRTIQSYTRRRLWQSKFNIGSKVQSCKTAAPLLLFSGRRPRMERCRGSAPLATPLVDVARQSYRAKEDSAGAKPSHREDKHPCNRGRSLHMVQTSWRQKCDESRRPCDAAPMPFCPPRRQVAR
jgi:hypothetical protein